MPTARNVRRGGPSGTRRRTRRADRAPKVNDAVEIWWSVDKTFYRGTLTRRHHDNNFRVVYDDGEMEDLNLTNEFWRFAPELPPPAPVDDDDDDDDDRHEPRSSNAADSDVVEVVLDGADAPRNPPREAVPAPKQSKPKPKKKDKAKDHPGASTSALNVDALRAASGKTPSKSDKHPSTSAIKDQVLEEGNASRSSVAPREASRPADPKKARDETDRRAAETDATGGSNATTPSAPSRGRPKQKGVKKAGANDKSTAKAKAARKGSLGETAAVSLPYVTANVQAKRVPDSMSARAMEGKVTPGAQPRLAKPITPRRETPRRDDNGDIVMRNTRVQNVHSSEKSIAEIVVRPVDTRDGAESEDSDDVPLATRRASIALQDDGRAFKVVAQRKATQSPTAAVVKLREAAQAAKDAAAPLPMLLKGRVKPARNKVAKARSEETSQSEPHQAPKAKTVKARTSAPHADKREPEKRADGGQDTQRVEPVVSKMIPAVKTLDAAASGQGKPTEQQSAKMAIDTADPGKIRPSKREDSVRSKSSSDKPGMSFAAKRKKKKRVVAVKGSLAARPPVTLSAVAEKLPQAPEITVGALQRDTTLNSEAGRVPGSYEEAPRGDAAAAIVASKNSATASIPLKLKMRSIEKAAVESGATAARPVKEAATGAMKDKSPRKPAQDAASMPSPNRTAAKGTVPPGSVSEKQDMPVDMRTGTEQRAAEGEAETQSEHVRAQNRKRARIEHGDVDSAAVQKDQVGGETTAKRLRAVLMADVGAREQPALEQPALEQPASEQPAREQPARAQPAREQSAREQPARQQPDLRHLVTSAELSSVVLNQRQQLATMFSDRITPLQNGMETVADDVRRLVSILLSFKQELEFYKDVVHRSVIDEARNNRQEVQDVRVELLQAIDGRARETELKFNESLQNMSASFLAMVSNNTRGDVTQRVSHNPPPMPPSSAPREHDGPSLHGSHQYAEMRATRYTSPDTRVMADLPDRAEANVPDDVANGHNESPTTIANVEQVTRTEPGFAYNEENRDVAKDLDEPMTEVALSTRVTHLVARQVTVWLLETPHEYNPSIGSVDSWAKQTAIRTFAKVGEQLMRFSSYTQAYQTLCSSLGNDAVELQWFVNPRVHDHLVRARRNYAAWDPPPSDEEWNGEMALLRELAERFDRALERFELKGIVDEVQACVTIANMAASDAVQNGEGLMSDRNHSGTREPATSSAYPTANGGHGAVASQRSGYQNQLRQ